MQSLVAGALIVTGLGHGTASEPVPVGDVALAGRTVRAVNLDGERGAALLDRVRADFDDAVAAVEKFWGSDWPGEVVVVATATQDQFEAEARLDPGREWADIAAVAVADGVDVAGRRAVAQRIVLAPGAAAMSDESLRIVLTHELFHFAARTGTAIDAPRWLTEGVADFVARPPARLPVWAAQITALPDDEALDSPGATRSSGYDRAWWFARFVAEEFGTDGLRRLYDLACGPGHGDFPWAVRTALGVELTELLPRWTGWLNR